MYGGNIETVKKRIHKLYKFLCWEGIWSILWLQLFDGDWAHGGQKYHLIWQAQAEICPNKAWKQLLVSTHISIKIFCQTYWRPLCLRSSQNDVIYLFPYSFELILKLILNLNYKHWAYFILSTSCHMVFLASTCLITIISIKIKVMDNF